MINFTFVDFLSSKPHKTLTCTSNRTHENEWAKSIIEGTKKENGQMINHG